MSYSELVNHLERVNSEGKSCFRLKTKWDVVCWLIGYQKVVTESDWENIMRLYDDGFVD